MPGVKQPRRGSLAYWPRKRTSRIYPHLTVYPEAEKAKVMGFAGYKAAMAHAVIVDANKNSPSFGQEITKTITILECPPLKVLGLRVYQKTAKGLEALNEVWAKDLPKDLARKIKAKPSKEEKIVEVEKNLEKIVKIRLIVSTQPRLSGFGKKKPEVFEVELGGKDKKEKIDFAKQILGKEIAAKDVIKEGELADFIGVTKGKGMAGTVKRFGIRIQVRHAKKKLRHIGTLGPQTPRRVRWTVPQAGQLGFFRRTELNKRILKIGENGSGITPKSGFKRYGLIKSNYVVVEGSIPGSKKRLVMFRSAIRPTKVKLLVPEIREIVV
jgi:large subunit ribosomal protein L3